MNSLLLDKQRYGGGNRIPPFQKYYRLCQQTNNTILKAIYRFMFAYYKKKNHIDLYYATDIGPGLYIGHPYSITINKDAKLGRNCNIHKGITIGQENRGKRKGSPVIGNEVWIGVNSTIVGKITIGDDVLIAPNSYVNCDVPSHSIVFGNPCLVKHRDGATKDYISMKAYNS